MDRFKSPGYEEKVTEGNLEIVPLKTTLIGTEQEDRSGIRLTLGDLHLGLDTGFDETTLKRGLQILEERSRKNRLFAGNEADKFPFVAPELLNNPEYRIFNRLVRAACTPERSVRSKSMAAFRKALAGEIDWGYEFQRFLYAVIIRPIYLIIRLVLFPFSRKRILFLWLFLFVIWCGMVIKAYWQLEKEMYPWENEFHAAPFKRALKEWHVQIGKYDLYDFQLEGRFCKLSIITADAYCRVYLDDRLIWGSGLAFYGGHFEMHYKTDKALKVGHFSVYNAGIVQPGEKRQSRLKLPKAPLRLKRETKALSVSNAVTRKNLSSEPVRTVPPRTGNSLIMISGARLFRAGQAPVSELRGA